MKQSTIVNFCVGLILVLMATTLYIWFNFMALVSNEDPQREAIPITTGNNSPGKLQQQQQQKPHKLSDIFEILCQHKVPTCCANVSDLSLLDELSLTLGKIIQQTQEKEVVNHRIANNNTSLSLLDPPTYRQTPLDCGGFMQERLIRPMPRYSIKGKTHITNANEILTGNTLDTPRVLIDFIMISYEINVLEARLYEYHEFVDYFCIFESSYNHRGWKKQRFVQDLLLSSERFEPFRHKIIYYNVDECDAYMTLIEKERANQTATSIGGINMFDIQNSLRSCRYTLFKDFSKQLPDNTMIICSDLDWLPDRALLQHIKHCEPTNEYGMGTPYNMVLDNDMIHSFRLGCQPNRMTCMFAAHSILRIRELNGLPGKTGIIDQSFDRVRNKTLPFFYGGVHLQDAGSLAEIIYRDLTHAEFAGFREEHLLDSRSYCDIDEEFLSNQQALLSKVPKHMHWRFGNRKKLNRSTLPLPHETVPDLTPQDVKGLRDCHVPWILLEQADKFPFLWGKGSYDMI